MSVNKFNPRKLLNSKWTAVTPVDRQKHFLITKVTYDDDGLIETCFIEAIRTNKTRTLDFNQLKDPQIWKQGWH